MMHVHIWDNINGMILFTDKTLETRKHRNDSFWFVFKYDPRRKRAYLFYVDNVPLEIMPSLVKLDLVALEKKIKS